MFSTQAKRNKERNRVIIQVEGRSSIEGHLFTLPGERVIDLLNDDRDFLPLELLSGDAVMVRKSEIQMVEPSSDDNKIDPLFLGSARAIFDINANTSPEVLKSTYKERLNQLHPDLVTKAGLHPALAECARMLTERLVSSYEKAAKELARDMSRAERIRRAQEEIEEDQIRRKVALKSA